MTNANKAKGDRAERAVLAYVMERFPFSWRTRAGWDDDRGDVVLDLLGDKTETYAVQVKDVASASWGEWFDQLRSQILSGGHRSGAVWWKSRGCADPAKWRVVMTGETYLGLMAHVRNLETSVRVLDGMG